MKRFVAVLLVLVGTVSMSFAEWNFDFDVSESIDSINNSIPEAVYFVTAYFVDGTGRDYIKKATVSSAAEAKTRKDEFLFQSGCYKVHIESKYSTIYRDCADDWYYAE